MRKFLVVLCTMAMVVGSISPVQIFAADSSVYDFDGDIIENPWGEIYTTVPEPTTKVEEPTTKVEEPTTKVEEPTTKVEEPTTKGEEESTVAGQYSKYIRISVQPCDVVSASGKTVKLLTGAVSPDNLALTYQWQMSKDGGKTWSNSSAAGAKTNQIQFTMSKTLDGRFLRCIVTDTEGNQIISRHAAVKLGTPSALALASQPEDVVGQVGEYVYATASATGNGVMYRWQMSTDGGKTWANTTAKGANASTMYVKMQKKFEGRLLRCVITDANLNTVTTNSVQMRLGKGKAFVVFEPMDTYNTVGETVKVLTLVAGSDLKYQWEMSKDGGKTWSNSSAAGAKTNQVQFTMSKTLNGRYLRCKVTDSNGQVIYTKAAYVGLQQ